LVSTSMSSIHKTNYIEKGIAPALENIILQYTYPRIDVEVSKHRNHLLKAPFCVHPKTGRICVPLDPASIDAFDPELVPTVGQLLQELDLITRPDDQAKNYNSGM
jgi:DNA primase small subunit